MNQFTQQINFLLSALSGAERIFDMMDEIPEIDRGKRTLMPGSGKSDGTALRNDTNFRACLEDS